MSKAPQPENKAAENDILADGIPKEKVNFKFTFEIIQNDLADVLVLFQWIDPTNKSSRANVITDLSKDWTKKNAPEPRDLCYSKDFISMLIDEPFVKNICGEKFQILFVSKSDHTVMEKIELNYSSLLFSTLQPKFEYSQEKLTVANLQRFSITILADKPLLTNNYREYLNPLQICVETAKNLPICEDLSIEYVPAYVSCKFFDDILVKTQSIPVTPKCKWQYKQVILLGLIDPLKLTTLIKTSLLEFEIHDRDEVIKSKQYKKEAVLANIDYEALEPKSDGISDKTNSIKKKDYSTKKLLDLPKTDTSDKKALEKLEKKPKAEPKKISKDSKIIEPVFVEDTRKIRSNNYGVAHFTLVQFLETDTIFIKLRRNIVPIKKYEKKEDSDNESPSGNQGRDRSPRINYFEKESYLTVSFELAYPIGPLDPIGNSPIKTAVKKKEYKVTTPTIAKLEQTKFPNKNANETSRNNSHQNNKIERIYLNKTKFERAVFVFSTESYFLRNEFLKEVRAINLETFGKDASDVFYLGFKALSEEEKQNSDLDIITGVEFIDKEYHIFILEGLAEKGMKRLGKNLPVCHPDSNEIRIIRNPEFKFDNRLYLDFGVDVKKIWFTKNVSQLIFQPEIYVRSKIPESVYQTLKAINEVRKCHNLKAIFAANLFPHAKDIIIIAQMYGDTSMYEDLNGNKSLAFKEIDLKSSSICRVSAESHNNHNQEADISFEINSVNTRSSKSPGITVKQAELLKIGEISADIRKLINKSKFELYNMHQNSSSKSSNREYFTQGNQHLNDYDEVKKGEVQHNPKRWITPEGFQNVIKKTLDDYITHPMKPSSEKIVAMLEYPWYIEKADQEKRLKQVRGESLKAKNRRDFDLSSRIKEQSSRADWESIESPYKEVHVNKFSVPKPSETARGSPVLEPIKDGRNSPSIKIIEQEIIKTTSKRKDQAPLSIFLNEKWKDTTTQYPVDRHFNKRKSVAGDFDIVLQNPGQSSPFAKNRLMPKINS